MSHLFEIWIRIFSEPDHHNNYFDLKPHVSKNFPTDEDFLRPDSTHDDIGYNLKSDVPYPQTACQ